MATEKSDQELVAQALKDRHAFAGVVERYESRLLRYVRRLGADQELAKDIVQEAFIKVYVNLNDYDASLSFSAWLYRIVHNESVNQFRKNKSQPAPVEREEELSRFEAIADELDVAADSDARRGRAALRVALAALEAKYREVLVLRFFEEKSYDEISDILQMPHGTVATYINRGKARLREILRTHKAVDE